MLIAAQEGHTDVLKFVLENGGDVSVVRDDGTTAVFLAAARGKLGTSLKGFISATTMVQCIFTFSNLSLL